MKNEINLKKTEEKENKLLYLPQKKGRGAISNKR